MSRKDALIRRENLRHKVALLPKAPGVYIFRDAEGQVIYVGKAKVLAHRVRSYFADAYDDGRRQIHALVNAIDDMEYIATATETEALVLEATFVKQHAPKYNVRLKDDKKYPYLLITNEDYPRLVYTRTVEKGKGRYFGPYPDAKAARHTEELLHRLFPIRTCTPLLPSPSISRVCLQYDIRRCQGPCVGLVSREEYNGVIDQAERFLRGQVSSVVRELEQQMEEAASRLQFERAAELRDRVRDIRKIIERQVLADPNGDDRDVIAIARDDTEAVAVVLEVREGKLIGRKDHSLTVGLDEPNEAILGAFMRQYYMESLAIPRNLDVMADPEDAETLEGWLAERRGGPVKLHTPQRGDKVRLIQMAIQNAEMLLVERRIRREKLRDRIPHAVKALERDLSLRKPPRRIVCFDISHLQGTDAVGSMVVFQDAKPLKSAYRHFHVRCLGGLPLYSDDFAAMREVVERQARHFVEDDGKEMPDLVVVDGGKGQLSSAKGVLDAVGLEDLPVIGLAKRLEEVFVPGLSDPQNIPRTSSGLKLLQQLRDEAHRFAVTFHRKQRGKGTLASALDDLPGVGPARKRALLKRFRSVAGIAAASEDEIAEVPGIGAALARVICESLAAHASANAVAGELTPG